MPFTFFAHQAPLLPFLEQPQRHVDRLAVVIGSMTPDLAYVLSGTRLRVQAHGWVTSVLFGVPVTAAICVIVVRVLAPVLPDHLPSAGPFRLNDYRGLAQHRCRPVPLIIGASLGALSHVAIDHTTHPWGWFAQHIEWYRSPVAIGGVDGTAYAVAQYAGHVGGTLACLALLASSGRRGWFHGAADRTPRFPVSRQSLRRMVVTTAASLGVGCVWVAATPSVFAVSFIRLAATLFAGLTVGALTASRAGRHRRHRQRNAERFGCEATAKDVSTA
jgi:Domain of unknown function (DUF4184)